MKKKKSLRKTKNMMLRETIGSFLTPFLVPLLLLTYDFPTEVNNIFIVVTSIVGPLVGLLFLRAYLIANTRYKESLKHVKPSFPPKLIQTSSISRGDRLKITSDNKLQRFPPISELLQQKSSSKPNTEVSHSKTEELQPTPLISDKKEGLLKVTSVSFSKDFPPISELLKQRSPSKPQEEFFHLNIKEAQSIPSISDKKEEIFRVTSDICKSCGNQLIKNASFCPYCRKNGWENRKRRRFRFWGAQTNLEARTRKI